MSFYSLLTSEIHHPCLALDRRMLGASRMEIGLDRKGDSFLESENIAV